MTRFVFGIKGKNFLVSNLFFNAENFNWEIENDGYLHGRVQIFYSP